MPPSEKTTYKNREKKSLDTPPPQASTDFVSGKHLVFSRGKIGFHSERQLVLIAENVRQSQPILFRASMLTTSNLV